MLYFLGSRIPSLAILGSHFSDFQKVLLNRLNPAYIALCFDNDKAGKLASASVCDKMDIPIMVGRYKSDWGKDPSDLSEDERLELFSKAEMWFLKMSKKDFDDISKALGSSSPNINERVGMSEFGMSGLNRQAGYVMEEFL